MKTFKHIGAEVILAVVVAPMIAWFATFVISTYGAIAEISNYKEDIRDIKTDVREIKTFLMEKK
jgi:hypothetical protein